MDSSSEWAGFETRLADCLESMAEGEFVVIDAGARYVQFAGAGDDGVRAEASSNVFLGSSDARITERDGAAMAALGWHLPDHPAPGPSVAGESAGSPNYYLDAGQPVDFGSLAHMAVSTFRLVFEVEQVASLRYSAASFEGGPIQLPALGVAEKEG